VRHAALPQGPAEREPRLDESRLFRAEFEEVRNRRRHVSITGFGVLRVFFA
jgi:hypothetical protein